MKIGQSAAVHPIIRVEVQRLRNLKIVRFCTGHRLGEDIVSTSSESQRSSYIELRRLTTYVKIFDYGATGMYSCLFYNLYSAASTTTQGRSCNSAAALFCESFLNNNVPFGSINQLVEFIHNVLNQPHNYNDADIITIHASLEETFFQLMSTTGFGWVPSEDEMFIIWEMLCKLDQSQLDRLFYKNNLFHFIDNIPVRDAILYMLQTLEAPFMDPNNPPKEIEVALKEFCNVLMEYVYYDKQIIDRLGKMNSLIRTVSILQDTDSAVISMDGWYRYVRNMCIGIPMKIKNQVVDGAEFAETGNIVTEPEKVDEYSFVDDDIIEIDRLINPIKVIPQDGLRYSIINIISYCMTIMINDYMYKYCQNANTSNERACLISMKNEFLNEIGPYSSDIIWESSLIAGKLNLFISMPISSQASIIQKKVQRLSKGYYRRNIYRNN